MHNSICVILYFVCVLLHNVTHVSLIIFGLEAGLSLKNSADVHVYNCLCSLFLRGVVFACCANDQSERSSCQKFSPAALQN